MLITIPLGSSVRMHSYVICEAHEQRPMSEHIINRMMEEIEKSGASAWPNMALVTRLSDGFETVQSVLDELFPQARKHFDQVKDFHLTMWAMTADHPADKKLMDLH